jgi:hypothetical protein
MVTCIPPSRRRRKNAQVAISSGGESNEAKGRRQVKKRGIIHFVFLLCAIAGGVQVPLAFGSGSKGLAFPGVEGWRSSGEPQTFSPEDLYQYIDGGADLYLTYDFQGLEVLEYQNEKEATVTVEVYHHQTPNDAFGVYSQERPPAPEFLAVGTQGHIGEDFLNFFAGPYYVKTSTYQAGAEAREVLISFSKKVAEALGEKGELPSILKSFPSEGKVTNSEKFIAKKFLGYAFLHSAFTADYVLAGKKFQVFIIESGNRDEARNVIETYLRQNGQLLNPSEEGRFALSDPHHGEVGLSWKGARVWGTIQLDDPAAREKYLKLVEEGLQQGR